MLPSQTPPADDAVGTSLTSVAQERRASALGGAWNIMTRRHFSPFKVFIERESRTVVVLNPKVGTTSFRHVVARAYSEVLGRADVSDGRYKLFKKAREFPFAPLRDYVRVFSHPEDYDFFCFVRNPYARMKSAWVDKLAFGHETGYPRSIRGKVIERLRNFAREHGLPGHEPGSPMPFETFVAHVDAGETGSRNHHWDEQYSILFMDRIRYAQIYKMETDFVEGTKAILARIGVPEDWTETALAKPRNESRKITDEVYTPELAAKVRHIFTRDFATLSYDIDSWQGI